MNERKRQLIEAVRYTCVITSEYGQSNRQPPLVKRERRTELAPHDMRRPQIVERDCRIDVTTSKMFFFQPDHAFCQRECRRGARPAVLQLRLDQQVQGLRFG